MGENKVKKIFLFALIGVGIFLFGENVTKSWSALFGDSNLSSIPVSDISQSLPKKSFGAKTYFDLHDILQMKDVTGVIDAKQTSCTIKRQNQVYSFQHLIPVVLHNGEYEADPSPMIFQHNTCYLSAEITKKIITDRSVSTQKQKDDITHYSAKQLAGHLSFLRSPIPGAHVSTVDSSLPGAPRVYRNGVHEGLDWYTYGTGVTINTKTPVLAMGIGKVVRSDQMYQEMTTKQRNQWLARGSHNNGQTTSYILDKLRGRTVWVQFANGVMARYCHLSRIPQQIKAGSIVKPGDIVGYVGNSGTSDGALHDNKGLHLHLDIFVYGQWLWGKYSIAERRMILEDVFNIK